MFIIGYHSGIFYLCRSIARMEALVQIQLTCPCVCHTMKKNKARSMTERYQYCTLQEIKVAIYAPSIT